MGVCMGCRAAVTGTGMERGECAMVQLRKTWAQPREWSLPWPWNTVAWQGGFALNWVTREHTHTWNSNKRTCCLSDALFGLCAEWVGCNYTGNMTQAEENISLGYFKCSKRANVKCLCVCMQVCDCACFGEHSLWRTLNSGSCLVGGISDLYQ